MLEWASSRKEKMVLCKQMTETPLSYFCFHFSSKKVGFQTGKRRTCNRECGTRSLWLSSMSSIPTLLEGCKKGLKTKLDKEGGLRVYETGPRS